jgi:hypothetical protein
MLFLGENRKLSIEECKVGSYVMECCQLKNGKLAVVLWNVAN